MAEGLNISRAKKVVLWAPHRCGARYVCEVLKQVGMQGGGENGVVTHRFGAPPGYRVALLVRNPYARLLSVWAWLQEIRQLDTHISFKEFVLSRGEQAVQPISRQVAAAIDYPFEHFYPDILLRLEYLAGDLAAAFVDTTIVLPPNRYQSRVIGGRPWQKWYDEETAAIVRRAYLDDFHLGRYSTEIE